jgi:hypothetical protein
MLKIYFTFVQSRAVQINIFSFIFVRQLEEISVYLFPSNVIDFDF